MQIDLSNRRVLVTGASRGIGLAVAHRFAEAGADLIVLSEDDAIEEAARQVREKSGRPVQAIICDISDRDSVRRHIGGLKKIDVLINNAAIERFVPILDQEERGPRCSQGLGRDADVGHHELAEVVAGRREDVPALRRGEGDRHGRGRRRPVDGPVARFPGAVTLNDIYRDGRVLLTLAQWHASLMVLVPSQAEERDLSWFDSSHPAALSSDGGAVLFTDHRGGAGSLEDAGNAASYLRRTDGSAAVRLGEGRAQALSPDGKWVLSFVQGSPPKLVLLPTGPVRPQPSTSRPTSIRT